MTLNLTHQPIPPPASSEEGLCSSMRFSKNPDKKFEVLANSAAENFNWDENGSSADSGSVSVSDDILALLPADPFGMDVAATFTAITGWFEGLDKDWGFNPRGFGTDEIEMSPVFTGLNLFWDGAIMFQPDVDTSGFVIDNDLGSASHGESNVVVCDPPEGFQDCGKPGAPHDGFFFALGYLGVRDLLNVEKVCRSLRDAVKGDPLLWKNVHIDQPLSNKITDDELLRLTGRAQGNLQFLGLVECLRITDSGLKRVFESNPGLTKLSVPGCVKLSIEGILFNMKTLKSAGAPGIKYLRIGGIYGITNSHFEELKFLLDADNQMQLQSHKPRFYHGGLSYISCDDDLAIDVEICPKCQMLRLVYDCPAESCQGEHHPSQLCRACTLCIARCVHCGRCINNCDYEETFCLDLLCLDCWKEILNHQDRLEGTHSPSSHPIFHRETYHFCLMASKD